VLGFPVVDQRNRRGRTFVRGEIDQNRWPSEDMAFCCLYGLGRGPPAMRTGNRAAGVLVSSDCLSGDNFTGAVIILLSNDR